MALGWGRAYRGKGAIPSVKRRQENGRSVDGSRRPLPNGFMQVTLSKELENFIAENVQQGGYASANEVVREALRNLKAKKNPAEGDSQELPELLLAAVRGPHRPQTAEDFARLRSRALDLLCGITLTTPPSLHLSK